MREKALVGERWIEAAVGGSIAVRCPASGAVLGHVPDCGLQDVAEAVAVAKNAFPAWKARTAEDLTAALRRLADLVEAEGEPLAALSTAEGRNRYRKREARSPSLPPTSAGSPRRRRGSSVT